MRNLNFLFILFLIASSLWACEKNSETPRLVEKTTYKVLFVGNSYTYYNDGVDFHLQKMLAADASSDSILYSCQKIAKGSYTLEAHSGDTETQNKIRNTQWNTVVVQEQSTRPINNPALFLEFATSLDLEIKKINAKTVLYMTWAEKDQPGDIEALATSYLFVAAQINAKTAPVGRVWEYIQKSNPQIELYTSDNKHPTLSGTYVAACVFFHSLFGKNPVQNIYIPAGLSAQNALAIRQAVSDYMLLKK